jgi:hypothetical protein
MLEILFGAVAQVVVGVFCLVITIGQSIYWLLIEPPTVRAVFIVSMEALAFAAYAIMATGLAVLWLDKRTPDV